MFLRKIIRNNHTWLTSVKIPFQLEILFWDIVKWTYYPPWCTGSKAQQWWYNLNSELLEILTWRFEINMKKEELLQKATDEVLSNLHDNKELLPDLIYNGFKIWTKQDLKNFVYGDEDLSR